MPQPRKPAKVLKMQGTDRKCRIEERGPELEIPTGIPEPPDWLLAEGRREWVRLLSITEWKAAISEADRPTLAVYCQLWARFVASETRGRKAHAEFPVTKLVAMMNLAGKLGLNPSDRTRIRMPEKKQEESKFARLKASG